MFRLLRLFMESSIRLLYSRRDLLLENLALRQQLAVFKSKNARPRLAIPDKLFWVAARRLWAGWKNPLMVVTPDTVVRWHRAGFRLYWKWLSRHRVGSAENGSAEKYVTSSSKWWPTIPPGALPVFTGS